MRDEDVQAALSAFADRQRDNGQPARRLIVNSMSPRDGGTRQTLLFSNGASARSDWRGGWLLTEPAVDPVALAEQKREFLVAALKSEEDAWNRYRSDVLEQYALHQRFRNLPVGASPESARRLAEGVGRIMVMRDQLAQLDEFLDGAANAERDERERLQREVEQAQHEKHAEAASAIRSLSI
jgi:hypothetical protein